MIARLKQTSGAKSLSFIIAVWLHYVKTTQHVKAETSRDLVESLSHILFYFPYP